MDARIIKKLITRLSNIRIGELTKKTVVLLPDFFVDHTLYIDDIDSMIEDTRRIYNQGGGNIPGIRQDIRSGGNAANTALALARLGVRTYLISKTDNLGLHLMNLYLRPAGVDISHVKTDGRLSITTVLEYGSKHVNVMIGDPGSVEYFSYDLLDELDLELISQADLVGVTNWNLNRYGTGLAKNVLKHAKKHDALTFFDSGDPSPRRDEIDELREEVLNSGNLDIFSLNENELRHYTGKTKLEGMDDMIKSAVNLKRYVKARLDLHTAIFTSSITDRYTVTMPTFKVDKVMRSTGAGDNWNAGDILGELLGLEPDERLLLANTVAAYYITSIEPIPPTLDDVLGLLKKSL